MKKKAIEKIPYFGLKKTSRKKDVKYIGVTAVKIVGHEKHLFLEVYRNKKESKEIPMVRIVLTKKDFGTYWPEKEEWTRQKIKPDSCYGRAIWGEEHPTWEQEKKENILQSTEDLERVKKFCKATVYNEEHWWEYIYKHEDDIVITARRNREHKAYMRRQEAWQTEWQIPENYRRKRSWTEQTDCIFTASIICITKSMVAGHI